MKTVFARAVSFETIQSRSLTNSYLCRFYAYDSVSEGNGERGEKGEAIKDYYTPKSLHIEITYGTFLYKNFL